MKQNAVSKNTVLSELLSIEVRLDQVPDLLLGFFQSTNLGEGAVRRLEVNVIRSPASTADSDLLPRPQRQQGRNHQTQHHKQDHSDGLRQKRILFFERDRSDQADANEKHKATQEVAAEQGQPSE